MIRTQSTALLTLNSADRQEGAPWNNFILDRHQNIIQSEAQRVKVQEVRFPFFITNVNTMNNFFWYGVATGGSTDNYTTPRKAIIPVQSYTPTTFVIAVNAAIGSAYASPLSTNVLKLSYLMTVDGTPRFRFSCYKPFAIYWSNPYNGSATTALTMVPSYQIYTPGGPIAAYTVTTPAVTSTVPAYSVTTPGGTTTSLSPLENVLPSVTLGAPYLGSQNTSLYQYGGGLPSNTLYYSFSRSSSGIIYNFVSEVHNGGSYINLTPATSLASFLSSGVVVRDPGLQGSILQYSTTPFNHIDTISEFPNNVFSISSTPPPLGSVVSLYNTTVTVIATTAANAVNTVQFSGPLGSSAASTYCYLRPDQVSQVTTLVTTATTVVNYPEVVTIITPAVTISYPATVAAAGYITVPSVAAIAPPYGPQTVNTIMPSQASFDANTNFFRLIGLTNAAAGATPLPSFYNPSTLDIVGDMTDFLYTRYLDIVSNSLHVCSEFRDGSSSRNEPGNILARVYIADDCSIGNYVAVAGYATVGWNPLYNS